MFASFVLSGGSTRLDPLVLFFCLIILAFGGHCITRKNKHADPAVGKAWTVHDSVPYQGAFIQRLVMSRQT